MFAGIVEARSEVLRLQRSPTAPDQLTRIWIARPEAFTDIGVGDSVAVDGVCLTIEGFDREAIQFALAAETLAVTRWGRAVADGSASGMSVNLERSLKLGDRIHGHWVSGHVDAAAQVVRVEAAADTCVLDVQIPPALGDMVWKKGSWAVNGVSLTINSVTGAVASHCLIPETLARTNLDRLRPGDLVNVEVDMMARAMAQTMQSYLLARREETLESRA